MTTKKVLAVLISLIMLVSVIPMSAFAGDEIKNYVHSAAVTVTAPVDGEKVDFNATGDSENYEITSVKWNDKSDFITDTEYTFAEGETYTVTVELTLKDNFVFNNLEATINENTPDESILSQENTVVTLKYSFVCEKAQEGEPEVPEEPEEPEKPSIFDTIIENLKKILGSVLGVLLKAISHIAGF